jgi:DNA-binding winged helix-turn-helix (wHTH) protein/tetratricopeptide (TPR) repeat protein
MIAPKPDVPVHAQQEAHECHYSFGPFCLRPDGTLLRDQHAVPLPPRELTILRIVVAHADSVVSAERLRREAWGEVHVTPDSLSRCVSSLRAALEPYDCIQTVYKRGYRFTLAVRQHGLEAPRTFDRRRAHPISPPRLAVLPFATAEGVPEFLGPGVAEETMLRLARERSPIAELVARDSVFHLAARGAAAREVGSALGADLALAGTIAALPMHFRVRIEMIRVSDAVQLWIEDFLIPRGLLAYADARVAKRITARIRNTVMFGYKIGPVKIEDKAADKILDKATDMPLASSPAPSADSPQKEQQRSEAYRIYLQSCAQWNTLERHHMQDAMRGFERAQEMDATLQGPRIHLAHGYLAQSSFGYMRADTAAELARKQIEIELSLTATGQSLYPALGWIHFHHDRDLAAAEDAFAHPQQPGYNALSTVYQTRFALGQGRFPDALAQLRAALDADPHSPLLHGRLAWALHLAGEPENAVEQAMRTQKLFPDHPAALFFCSIVLAASCSSGDSTSDLATGTIAVTNRLTQRASFLDAGYATLAYAHARQGRMMEARSLLERQQWLSRERFVMRSFHAPVLVELGEYDAAIEALVVAEQQHCPWLFELLVDPRLAPLRSEAEFQRLSAIARPVTPANVSVA